MAEPMSKVSAWVLTGESWSLRCTAQPADNWADCRVSRLGSSTSLSLLSSLFVYMTVVV